jgi:hypothetical protein
VRKRPGARHPSIAGSTSCADPTELVCLLLTAESGGSRFKVKRY